MEQREGPAVVKIQVVALDEDQSISAQIERWKANGWRFRGFLRRAGGIWDRPQALFEQEIEVANL
jgi:hypothetical protein